MLCVHTFVSNPIMMKTIDSLFVLLLILGIQSCASNNFSRQKYTNFGHTGRLHLKEQKHTEPKENSLEKTEADEVGRVQTSEEIPEQPTAGEVLTDAASDMEIVEIESVTAQPESGDTLIDDDVEVIDLDELHRQFNSVSIGGIVSTLATVGSSLLVIIAIESIGSAVILFIPVALAILSFVLLIIAVKRGRNLNRIHNAIGYSPQWTFYLLYVLDIVFLCLTSFAALYAVVLFLLILVILMGGGF